MKLNPEDLQKRKEHIATLDIQKLKDFKRAILVSQLDGGQKNELLDIVDKRLENVVARAESLASITNAVEEIFLNNSGS